MFSFRACRRLYSEGQDVPLAGFLMSSGHKERPWECGRPPFAAHGQAI